MSITLPDGLISIGEWAFYNCSKLTNITLPDSLTSIGKYAFESCSSLTNVTIPAGVTTIGTGTFLYCRKLTNVTFQNGLTGIGSYAFERCGSLTNVTIPASVTYISQEAFFYCGSLRTITFVGNVPTISSEAFSGVTATVYYPADDTTWTDSMKQNYGGTLTWEAVCMNHSYDSVVTAPTCTEGGYTTHTCSVCGDSYTDSETAATGHNYVDGICTNCGEEKVYITITTQPTDYVGLVGDTATFTVVAEGNGLTYQWYYYDTAAAAWKKAGNGTTAALNVEFKSYRSNQQYRCEITDENGHTVTTDTVKLMPEEVALAITTHPVDYVGAVNDSLSMTVEATGNGLIYQWYYSDDDGATWKKSGSPGYDTNTLQPILRAYRDGYQFYCQITDVFGNSVQSEVASMTVRSSAITITAQPADVEMAVLGKLYQFTVAATGDNLTYRWEVSTDGGNTWELSWNQGYESATLNVRMNANRDGYQYRCVITSGLKIVAVSDAAVLDMQDPSVTLTSQPTSVSSVAGKTISFHVGVTGTDLTYQWYRSNDKAATWTETYLGGYNTDTLSFVANSNRAVLYKCKITDGSGKTVWTDYVKLQLLSAELAVLTQPEDVTCASGETAVFTVAAQGDTLQYQWYSSTDGGSSWAASYMTGYNTDTFSFTVNATRAARLYKCIITDAGGNTVETDAVSVTIG